MKKHETIIRLLKGAFLSIAFLFSFAGLVWAAGGGGGHEDVHNSWLKIDTWKAMNFGILAVLLFFITKKPVAQFFSSRTKSIAGEINALEKKKADAEKKLAEYQARFKNLDEESKQVVEESIKQGKEAKKRILAEAQVQAEKLEDMARQHIEQEFKTAKAMLQQEIAQKAMEKAEEIIKSSITAEDQEKLVDEYLKKVVA